MIIISQETHDVILSCVLTFIAISWVYALRAIIRFNKETNRLFSTEKES
jgi:hypothetical protein